MYDLTIALAAIRKQHWKRLYDSIVSSVGKYSFELIFCGPHDEPPEEMKHLPNVKCVVDFGCPTRAQQKACLAASGKYLAWSADDGWFLPGKIEKCLDMLESNKSERKALVTHYNEANKNGLENYNVNYHESVRSPYLPNNYVVFNSAFVQTEHFKELGGFDCSFEVCPLAFVDYGNRTHRDGADVMMLNEVIFECTHFPDRSGDHAPIHDAQTQHDVHVYRQIYANPNCIGRTTIPIDNWVNASSHWERRFGKQNAT